MNKNTRVVVIGAGPAGLAAAVLLSEAGFFVQVLEADPGYVGGISRTVEFEGFRFDIGGHRFFSKSKEVVDFWNRLLGDNFLSRPRMSRIYYGGKFYSYPLRGFEAMRNLGLVESVRCVASYLKARVDPQQPVTTFHQWVANHFGERLFSIFFRTYTEKVWGMSCDEISADWAAQRIKGLSLWQAAKSALLGPVLKRRRGEVIKTLIDSFQYPKFGPGMMWERAAALIREHGSEVRLGQRVERLECLPDGQWRIEAVDAASGAAREFFAHHVVCSAALRDLGAFLLPRLESRERLAGLRYRDFLTVALIFEDEEPFPDNWVYIHEPSVKVGRIQNFKAWSPFMVPDESYSCLGLEYFCFEGDDLWSADDESLVRLALDEICRLGLARRETFRKGCVTRQPKAYPIYDGAYKEIVDAVRAEVEQCYPSLHLVGRNGLHKYNNQDHSMMTGFLAAKNIIAGERLYDVWQVNEDAEYHEAGAARGAN